MSLHVASFGGGISVDGSADSQRTDEVQIADSYDLSNKGMLIVTSEPTDYLELDDNGVPAAWTRLWGILECAGFNFSKVIAVGEGINIATPVYVMTSFNREGEVSPYLWASGGSRFRYMDTSLAELSPPLVQGVTALGSDFAGVFPIRLATPGTPPAAAAFQARLYFINIGAREGTAPNQAPGLYVVFVQPPGTVPAPQAIGNFDALGTGASGLFTVPVTFPGGEGQANGGTHGRQLYFRGIVPYNNHLFGWGFDATDERIAVVTAITNAANGQVTAVAHGFATGDSVLMRRVGGMAQVNGQTYVITVTGANTFLLNVNTAAFGVYSAGGEAVVGNGDGPARVMFSNLGQPLKFGNDNVALAGVDRVFTDSDAIVLGDAGELIRAAIAWEGRLFFGTNKGLHYVMGYGRDSFIADGATPVMRSYNVIGPKAIIEGPDKLLYGVCEQGLWVFNGSGVPLPLFQQLRDFKGRSNGYWDQIWTDVTRSAAANPGTTNQDLVWMAIDWERQQVIIGIPWCSIANGYGVGNDTVIIKYHPQTGGFTRQQFTGVQYTAAGYFRSLSQQASTRMLGTATAAKKTIQRYGYRATTNDVAALPTALPLVRFGPYAPFGADGRGVVRRFYLVIAWDAISMPMNIAGITNANPAEVTTADVHKLKTGQQVEIAGVNNMMQIVGGPYTITVTGALTFTLNGVNSTAFTPYGGPAPLTVDLPLIFTAMVTVDERIVLDADPLSSVLGVFGLSLRSAPPTTPSEGDLWVDESQIDQNIGNATAGAITPALGGYLLRMRHDTSPVAITGATKANPCVITAPAHGLHTGERVSIRNVAGMTQLNNVALPGPYTKDYTALVVDADHFSLVGIDSSGFGVYTSGGQAALAWKLVPGLGGAGNRLSVPIPVARKDGTRVALDLQATTLGRRYQIEGFALNPGDGTPDA